VGSLLATPHISLQDFTMLLVVGWLLWRTGGPTWLRPLLLLSLIPLEMALVLDTLPIVALLLIWLAMLLALPSQPATTAGEPISNRRTSPEQLPA
jgi:hypothetical protein